MKRLFVAVAALSLTGAAAPSGASKTDPVTGEAVDGKPKDAKAAEGAKPAAAPAEAKKEEVAAQAPAEPQKIDPKTFDKALESYFLGYPKDAAGLLFAYTEGMPQTDENYAWAQFFLA